MTRTQQHLLIALAWMVGWPLIFTPLFIKGIVPPSHIYTVGATIIWALGFITCFTSWAWRDAPEHGKPRMAVCLFTAAWCVVFALAMFPYLLYTRGMKPGAIACLQFFGFCVVCAGAFFGTSLISRMFI